MTVSFIAGGTTESHYIKYISPQVETEHTSWAIVASDYICVLLNGHDDPINAYV